MEKNKEKLNNQNNKTVHFVLLHSYGIFLLAVILGLFLDPILKTRLFSEEAYSTLGFLMIIIGSLVILWAQNTTSIKRSRNFQKSTDTKSYFNRGPYKYSRSPTHLGLFVMILGFSLIINSFFSFVLTFIVYIFTKFLFVKKQEQILEEKYGNDYLEYKKHTKNWL